MWRKRVKGRKTKHNMFKNTLRFRSQNQKQ